MLRLYKRNRYLCFAAYATWVVESVDSPKCLQYNHRDVDLKVIVSSAHLIFVQGQVLCHGIAGNQWMARSLFIRRCCCCCAGLHQLGVHFCELVGTR